MTSPAHIPGTRYRVQIIDGAHGMPVKAHGAQSQADAITAADAMRADPANAGREVEIVLQARPHYDDPTRWRWHNERAQWEAVQWSTDDSRVRQTRRTDTA